MSGQQLNEISEGVIGAAITVHRELGPGLLESCYEACLQHELLKRGFEVQRQVALPVTYDGVRVDCGFRIDLTVNRMVLLELKATDRIERIHEVQLLTYLKLTGMKLGLIMNFNVVKLIDGVKRIVRDFPD